MKTRVVAAVDQGTTSSRCLLFDREGKAVSMHQLEHRQIYPRPGWVEHDAEEIWSRTAEVIRGAIAKAKLPPGAIAAVATVLSMRDGCIPPTINLTDPDPGVGDLDLTPLVARQRDVRVALVNAFGFGGQNSAIVLRRWDAA